MTHEYAPVRSLDIQNAQCRARWYWRFYLNQSCADLRNPLRARIDDELHAHKVRLARHHLDAIHARKRKAEEAQRLPANVSMFHRRQAE